MRPSREDRKVQFTQSAIDNFESPKGKPNHDEWDDSLFESASASKAAVHQSTLLNARSVAKDHVLLLGKIGKMKQRWRQIAEQILSLAG